MTAATKLKDACSLEKLWQTRTMRIKKAETSLCQQRFIYSKLFFPVVMYGCEIWTIKKAERKRIDAFKLWCWRRLLKVPWTARRSNLSILKEINPEYGGTLTEAPVLWSPDGQSHWKWEDSLEKTLMLRKIEGRRGRGWKRMRWLNRHEFEQTAGGSEGQPGVLQSMELQRVRHTSVT